MGKTECNEKTRYGKDSVRYSLTLRPDYRITEGHRTGKERPRKGLGLGKATHCYIKKSTLPVNSTF
jgi:hypothetical protein